MNSADADPDRQRYVSVAGRAWLLRDRAKIDELWSPLYKAWFPDGKDDPELALLRSIPRARSTGMRHRARWCS
jgi:general stress protein 26